MHSEAASGYFAPQPDAARAGHEVSDITVGGIRNFMIILFGTLLLTFVLMAGLLYGMVKFQQADERKTMLSPLAAEVPEPPSPALQPSRYHNTLDADDLKAMHATEKGILTSYGWIGSDHKAARIPIKQAMELVLANNTLKVTATPGTAGTHLTPTPWGGAAGLMINAANPLDHAPPSPSNTPN